MTTDEEEGYKRQFTAKALEDIEFLTLNMKVIIFMRNFAGVKKLSSRIST
jgi:hypothetical protein